jgi:hypothetical protein
VCTSQLCGGGGDGNLIFNFEDFFVTGHHPTSRYPQCLGKIVESFELEILAAQRSVEKLGVELELKIRCKHGSQWSQRSFALK